MSEALTPDEAGRLICQVLGPHDLKAPYNKPPRGAHRLWGQCAVASEALFYATGGLGPSSQAGPGAGGRYGWTVWRLPHEGSTHWFLRDGSGKIWDLTKEQFHAPVPYERAKKTFFVTSSKGQGPSRRVIDVLRRIGEVKKASARVIIESDMKLKPSKTKNSAPKRSKPSRKTRSNPVNRSAPPRTTHLEGRAGHTMCGEQLYGDSRVFSVKDCTCYYCGTQWEKQNGGLSSLPAKHRANPVKKAKGPFSGLSIYKRAPRSGTRVVFRPSPASLALYSSPPEIGEVGTVRAGNMGGRIRKLFLTGPGGGLLYVSWDQSGFSGVSLYDVRPAPSEKLANPLPKLSNASSRYGASMGRRTVGRDSITGTGKKVRLHVQRVTIDRGGYDSGGAYWGVGAPLWRVTDNDLFETFLRAPDREAAKRKVLEEVPSATFFR